MGGITFRIHGDAFGRNNEAKEAYFLNVKFTLLEFDVQAVFLEFFENHTDVLDVFFECVGINEDIVDIDDCEQIEKFANCIIRIGLKRAGGIGEPERHD